jgi:hypothetical protein
METYSLFQDCDGGSIPTSALEENKFKVEPIEYERIRYLLEKFHYKGGKIGGGIAHCLALRNGMTIIGGVVVGLPRHERAYNDGGNAKVYELRRMVCLDEAPKNTESYFLAKTIWWLRKYTDCTRVLSYADGSVGHKGTIYKAANFKFKGLTSPTKHVYWKGMRYHPRSLTIDRPYSHLLRKAVQSGEAKVTIEEPKSIWIYEIVR